MAVATACGRMLSGAKGLSTAAAASRLVTAVTGQR